MKGNEGETKVVQFQDSYLEAYFPDGTSIAWLNDSITYYSLKGNRINVSIDTLHLSQEVSQKIAKIVRCQNKFNDQYVELPANMSGQTNKVLKKYKIKEFTWNSPIVRSTEKGFEVTSDDNSVKFCLLHDLYRVNIEYMQLTSNRQVSKEGTYLGIKNQKRMLLQKYSYKYHEFPISDSLPEIEYQYHIITKEFTIFNLPPRWCPPIKHIWGYLLANEMVPHPFCYIDFLEPQNRHLDLIQASKMPPRRSLEDCKKQSIQRKQLDISTYPLFGKPNHNFKFKWMHIQNQQVDLVAYAFQSNNMICQKEGFWFIEGSKVIYNSKNKDTSQFQVNINAFPITIRFEGQTQRQIKPFLQAFHNYLKHREFLDQKESQKVIKKTFESQTDVICQEIWEGIGLFKAFRNQMSKANFEDKTIVTIRDSEIKVIDDLGKCWIVGSDALLNRRFGWYIDKLSNFHQKIFDPEAYQSRMQLNEMLEQRKQLSNVFLQVTKHIQNNDY